MSAASRPGCVQAASNDVARKIYREHIEPYDLNPVTAADVMEAFAADMQWADQYLIGQSRRDDAFAEITRACRDKESPLARFFDAAARVDDVALRRDLMRVRSGLVANNQGICEALPSYYESVVNELNARLSRRMRTGQCTVTQWQPSWE